MRVHLRIRRWVHWWIVVGIIGGIIAGVNLLGQNLTPAQDRILILMGGAHWILGGIVCWAFDGIQVEPAAADHDLHPTPTHK